ncbi:hypothetical protein HAX54_027656, partial [Datura stramonium]|nr:hypothetical protein [Datura stramonium]
DHLCALVHDSRDHFSDSHDYFHDSLPQTQLVEPRCSSNLTTAAVSPQWKLHCCSGTILSSSSIFLEIKYGKEGDRTHTLGRRTALPLENCPSTLKAGVPREVRDCMLVVMHPSNPLKGKGAPRRIKKERKTDSKDDTDDLGDDGDGSSGPTGPFKWMEVD